jgi:hypothetical protein
LQNRIQIQLKPKKNRIEKKKRIETKKKGKEAYLAATRLAGPTSQPTGAQPGIPKRYAADRRDPPNEDVVFNLRSGKQLAIEPGRLGRAKIRAATL